MKDERDALAEENGRVSELELKIRDLECDREESTRALELEKAKSKGYKEKIQGFESSIEKLQGKLERVTEERNQHKGDLFIYF